MLLRIGRLVYARTSFRVLQRRVFHFLDPGEEDARSQTQADTDSR